MRTFTVTCGLIPTPTTVQQSCQTLALGPNSGNCFLGFLFQEKESVLQTVGVMDIVNISETHSVADTFSEPHFL